MFAVWRFNAHQTTLSKHAGQQRNYPCASWNCTMNPIESLLSFRQKGLGRVSFDCTHTNDNSFFDENDNDNDDKITTFLSCPSGEERRGGDRGTFFAWLAWPWASQATARGRFRAPAVLAIRVPWACEGGGVCRGAGGPCTQEHASAHPEHHGCVGHLLSLTAGGQDSMHVSGRDKRLPKVTKNEKKALSICGLRRFTKNEKNDT